jgi:toluene monooxygenase system ferredoxin subunit
MAFREAATLDQVWSGEMLPVVLEGVRVLLVNHQGELSAFEDRCAHQGVPLSLGRLQGGVLCCSAHEWQYDARTGCGLNPSAARLKRYPVRVEGERILVDLEGAAQAPA